MTSLKELLRESTVADVGPVPAPRLAADATLNQAIQTIARVRRGALVVVNGTRPAGIFTERDVLYRLRPEHFTSAEERNRTLLGEVMSSPVVTIQRKQNLVEAVGQMDALQHRHLVVVDRHGDLLGLLTSTDIIHYLTDHFPEDIVNLPPHLHQRYLRPDGG